MRLLVDEHGMDVGCRPGTSRSGRCGYTNHTLLAEALEKWPLPLFGTLLPRHLEIIYEINRRFLDDVRLRHPGDDELRRAAVAHRRDGRASTCAWRTSRASAATPSTASRRCTPSCSSRPCSRDFHAVAPEKFFNVTNGVTPRRWMVLSNPRLSALHHAGASATAGSRDLETSCARLEPLADDARLPARSGGRSRPPTSARSPRCIEERTGIVVDPAVAVRHPGEADPRVQAPAPERAARRSRSTTG